MVTTACAAAPSQLAVHLRAETAASAAHNDTSTPFNLVSLPALIEHEYDGRDFRVDHVVAEELASTRYHVSYHSGDLEISGQLSVPRRRGKHPLVVLAHGYERPATYRSGVALAREAAYLVALGYVVLLPDYRNHAASDRDSAEPVARPLGYTEDLVNAVLAIRRARLPYVDVDRVGLLGRSMGGGVALNAAEARPDLFDALVLYSPVSSSAADNYQRWVAGSGALDDRVLAAYGSPGDNPGFWREASARGYLNRVDVPVQVHHGVADPVCPVSWSRVTVAALRRAGQSVEYFEYPGEDHRFDQGWPAMVERVAGFLDDHV